MEQYLYKLLEEAAGQGNIFREEPMREHTTFRIGGNAEVFAAPDSIEGIGRVWQICRANSIPCHVVGNGSNLLVGDRGVRGVVLQIYKNFSDIAVDGTCLTVQAGTLLARTAAAAAEHGLTGLEFASGIPGTVGGAVTMNAGAYGGEMKDVLTRVKVLDESGGVHVLTREELRLGYRTSLVQEREYLAVEAQMELAAADQDKIYARMEELKNARKEKQPIEYPSAGSTFKRPEGYFAGKLIMDAGLRGYRVGDAQVSEKHCGFVINRGQATAAQVMELISHIQAEVFRRFGVRLEMEVKRLGDF